MHSPGGKVMIPLPPGTRGSAVFGGAFSEYRYRLERVWDEMLPTVMFLMTNPSTADPLFDDPTIAKCTRYAKRWGYGRLLVGNLFAYRATNPKQIRAITYPFGSLNLEHLMVMGNEANIIVFAYGKSVKQTRESLHALDALMGMFKHKAHYLHLCADGTPSHPLYLKGNLTPTRWNR